MAFCFQCGGVLPERIYRNTRCESCGTDTKVCLNCDFYDRSAHWECRETIPEPVREKDRANFCDYFHAGPNSEGQPRNSGDERQQQARDALNRLFGDE